MPDLKDAELSALLSRKNALVVHFSHCADMQRKGAGVFPKDLLNAVAHQHEWTLSCCVVWPGHKMSLPGSVGVIFEPHVASVLSTLNEDSGSYGPDDQPDQSDGVTLTRESLFETFNVKEGAYNEWRIKGAKFIGIFIDDIDFICAKKEVKYTIMGESYKTLSEEKMSLDEVFNFFPDWKIYTFDVNSNLVVCARR